MTGITRELKFTYNGYAVAGTSGRRLDGKYRMHDSDESASFEADIILGDNTWTEARFATECLALEAALRTPRADLLVQLGSQTLMSLSQSSNTGYDAAPDCRKIGDDWDTGRTRKYHFAVTYGRPASYQSLNGRRKSTIDVSYNPAGRRKVVISGEYTTDGATAAKANYLARIVAYESSIMTALGITSSQRVMQQFDYFETDKVVRFRVEHNELIYALLNAAIRNQTLRITRRQVSGPDTQAATAMNTSRGVGVVRRLLTLDVDYSGWVDTATATDIAPLKAIADSLYGPLAAAVRAASGAGFVALIEDAPTIEPDENKIAFRQVYSAAIANGFTKYVRTEAYKHDTGNVLVPVWDGQNFSRYAYRGPSAITCEVTEDVEYAGVYQIDPLGAGMAKPTAAPDGIVWAMISFSESPNFAAQGIPGQPSFNLASISRRATFEGYRPVQQLAGDPVRPIG